MASPVLIDDTIRRPALRYFGGKFRIAPWILSHFPAHEVYVEPFGGGAGVLLRKMPSEIEVYNDLDGDVVNFFQVLRERPEDLIRAIDLTPWSRDEFFTSLQACDDPLERARRLYVRSWQGIGGKLYHRTGWRLDKNTRRGCPMVDDWSKIEYLWEVASRWKEIYLEHDDACRVIEKLDSSETLVYLDPPYLSSTRNISWARCAYAHEMTDDDHRRLGEVARSLQGMVIISGYPSELYEDLYGDWLKVTTETRHSFGGRAVESLWISPAAQARGRQMRLM